MPRSITVLPIFPPNWPGRVRKESTYISRMSVARFGQAVLSLLNNFARVPVCGLIAQYNGLGPSDGKDRLPATMREILSKSLTVRGFIYSEFVEQHYPEFLREIGAAIAEGRIRYREDIVDGLERAPEAFIGLLDGKNFGKLIVRVTD
jgi:NADPH-dependent curcumin reductase CurA